MDEFKFDKGRYYVWVKRPHTTETIRVQCGMGTFMRWECVRWFIEEQLGLHQNEKRQNGIIIGQYLEEKDKWFSDESIVEKQRILLCKVVPYWYFFEYDGNNTREAPIYGPVYHPPPIRAFYKTQGIDLPALMR